MPLPSDLINIAAQHRVTFPVALPFYHSPPNMEHLREWANVQLTPKLREVAHAMVDGLQYISFETFLTALKKIVADFNNNIKEEPYVLLVQPLTQHAAETGCSDQWVAALAFEHCALKHPVSIINANELPKFLQNHPEVKHILTLDDASYSGQQKKQLMHTIQLAMIKKNLSTEIQKLTLHLGIPFISEAAREHINESDTFNNEDANFKSVILYSNTVMKSIADIVGQDLLDYANELDIEGIDDKHMLTYFDHKYADLESNFRAIYNGEMLFKKTHELFDFLEQPQPHLTDSDESNEILKQLMPNPNRNWGYNIPHIIPPYKVYDYEICQRLKDDITQGRVGNRNAYPVTNPTVLNILNTTSTTTTPEPYVISIITTEQQNAIDAAIADGRFEESTYKEYIGPAQEGPMSKKLKH